MPAATTKRAGKIAGLKRQYATSGDTYLLTNIAATYRQLGNYRRAYAWWCRAAGPLDGDAWLEVGFARQYGVGTRVNRTAAIQAYRLAIRSKNITPYGLEEAAYHLAVALLDRGRARNRLEAERLLKRAAADDDHAQAAELLAQLRSDGQLAICRCRRWLRPSLGGRKHCTLHGRRSNQRLQPTARSGILSAPRLNRGR